MTEGKRKTNSSWHTAIPLPSGKPYISIFWKNVIIDFLNMPVKIGGFIFQNKTIKTFELPLFMQMTITTSQTKQ